MGAAVAEVSAEIGYLDLTPRFHAEAAAGGLVYLPDDTHWSAEGPVPPAPGALGRTATRLQRVVRGFAVGTASVYATCSGQ